MDSIYSTKEVLGFVLDPTLGLGDSSVNCEQRLQVRGVLGMFREEQIACHRI